MISILPPEETKKIAAGEVIDRPAALVRELIDNALDSGAVNIEVSIEDGGMGKIEIIDDGGGMSREDLALCTMPHATSKIKSFNDLSRSVTLGFRGEALAAAAAVARLEIVTSTDGREAWLLETFPSQHDKQNMETREETENHKLSQTRRKRGTSVRSFGLFDAIPARKRFLKRNSSEAVLCRQIFLEKALAFPGISFRFVQDGRLKLHLMPCTEENKDALQKRFGELILTSNERLFLYTLETSGSGFTITIVFGGPELYRRDRKQQFIFTNKRRIQDFGLLQALEYGLAGFFPNDSHPVGAVFIEIDPALADFNIHPAKREVRFADAGAIHHSISSALRDFVQNNTYGAMPGSAELNSGRFLAAKLLPGNQDKFVFPFDKNGETTGAAKGKFLMEGKTDYSLNSYQNQTRLENGFDQPNQKNQDSKINQQKIRLAGRVFNLFILVEQGDTLYLIDQHAAHERLLYNQFLSAPMAAQELLVPVLFTSSSYAEEQFLKTNREKFTRLGIVLENEGNGAWRIEALSSAWKNLDPVEEILALQTAGKDFHEQITARLACRTAVKDGDYLDDETALSLAEAALSLADNKGQLPRCPHGRPLWTKLTKEDLFKAVQR